MMNPLLSTVTHYLRLSSRGRDRIARHRRGGKRKQKRTTLWVEQLEDRAVPTVSISIANATVKEQGNLGLFAPGNAALLQHPTGLAFGPDRTSDGIPDLYVLGHSNNINVYDGKTGAYVEQFASSSSGLNGSAFLTIGPDGSVFTSTNPGSGTRDTVLRIDQSKTVTTFISPNNPGGNGGLSNAQGLTFGPDGNFYVASAATNQVLRYNGQTGAFIDAFVAAGSGGLSVPSGIAFGLDTNNDGVSDLYVASNGTNQVLAYSGKDGLFLGVFVAAGSGGLNGPHDMHFGPDGNLYVVSSGTSYEQVFRYNGTTGAFMDIPIATGSGIGPETTFIALDGQGELYAGSQYADEVLHDSTGPLVSLSGPSSTPITVNFSTADGTAIQGTDYAATSGQLTFAPGQTNMRILVSPADEGVNEPNQAFNVNLSNPVGATLTQSQSAVTIQTTLTKLFVVDATQNNTYRYESSGAAVVSNWLTFGTTFPTGIAANAAGTTYWVVDGNKKVYVYNKEGMLQGSWSDSSLPIAGSLNGIASNGTDIWLLDAGKVFKYTGAATRLSGSQTPDSSFKLTGGDTYAQDIVTDGRSFWVVDSSKLKVFKYSLSGAALGSWSIDPANAHPTGITINPNNVSDVWIVDSGTDKVYQYVGAASRTSGSQNAAATFALNPYDTNPQGIADPPPANLPLTPTLAPIATGLPSDRSLNAEASRGPSARAGVAPMSGRDALFATLARQSPPEGATSTADAVFAALAQQFLPAGGTPSAAPVWPPAGAGNTPNPADYRATLALVGRPGASPGLLATDLGEVPLADADSPSSSGTDALFSDLGDDPLAPVGADPWLDLPW
jgi:sugar lactone lactonase YvrE